jgi:hypothetical protein
MSVELTDEIRDLTLASMALEEAARDVDTVRLTGVPGGSPAVFRARMLNEVIANVKAAVVTLEQVHLALDTEGRS